MSGSDRKPRHLPPGLTATVRVVERILGDVVADVEGRALYEVVEGVRRDMVDFREAGDGRERDRVLDRAAERLGGLSIRDRTALARAYTLYLQLVNVCENAYRTHRLRQRPLPEEASAARAQLTFVLTAHPTESRSPRNIQLLRRVQDHVVDSLERGHRIDRREVGNLIRLAWTVGTHPPRKPSVDDEASHLFSLLTDPILSEASALAEAGHEVLFRSWVGGDKDGHPGVGGEQTVAALGRARTRLLDFAETVLMPPVREDVRLLADPGGEDGNGAAGIEATSGGLEAASGGLEATSDGLEAALDELELALDELRTLRDGDGARVEALRGSIDTFQAAYRDRFGIDHPALERLRTLLAIFPALVVPLELREERGRFSLDDPIAGMMRRLEGVAEGGEIGGYARAVVVSMTLEASDLLEAQRLADGVFGPEAIPVIPLFELPDVLERAPAIIQAAWRDEGFRRAARARGHLEVMLGYSDTAKRMGMLASRVALNDAMRRIGAWAESEGVKPLYFHGHGGSVGRGGGRIEDLFATWPPGAGTPYKYTLQGEMVERTLATPEILRSLVEKVALVQHAPPSPRGVGELARRLADASAEAFAVRVSSEPFRRLLERATPYGRLQTLTIGSRPARRGEGGLEELRAIPWVLCWTQTRLLLHAWLGIGRAWRALRDEPEIEARLAEAREEDPLFRSYARLLSFTMAKTEPALWDRYRRALVGEATDEASTGLAEDYEAALDLACRAVGADALLPDRPWLAESIRYRAPMIHPLNLLQIELLGRDDWSDAEVALFRETVTGIAAGMLTTG